MQSIYTNGATDKNGVVYRMTEGRALHNVNGDELLLVSGRWCDTVPGAGQILGLYADGSDWVVEFTGAIDQQVITTIFEAPFPKTGISLVLASTWGSNKSYVLTRDPVKRSWSQVVLTKANSGSQIRSFGTHTDAVTGVDMVFAGQEPNGVFSGTLVGNAIVWGAAPELLTTDRPMAFASLDRVLYVSIYESIYKRNDGLTPTWTKVATNPWPGISSRGDSGLRGMGVSPLKDGSLWMSNTGSKAAILSWNPTTMSWKTLYAFPGNALPAYNKIKYINKTIYVGYQLQGEAGYLTSLDGVTWALNPVDMPGSRTYTAVRDLAPYPFVPGEIVFVGYDCDKRPSHDTGWVSLGP
jgi:hypothetical protein